jgi:hypothetical protein
MALIGVEKGMHLPVVNFTPVSLDHAIMDASELRRRALKHSGFLFDIFLSQSAFTVDHIDEWEFNP